MSIIAARLDNRLLHGIVATQWVPELQPKRVMVIDDGVAADPAKKSAMKMSRPSTGCALSIIDHETAYANFKAGKYDGHSVMVIAQDAQTFADLIEMGQEIPELVIGGTAELEEKPGLIKVSRRACINEADIPLYKKIAASGTKIEVRYIPSDHAEPLSKYVDL